MADRKDKITKGNFNLRGLITKLDKKKSITENEKFRKLQFGVKTSDDNIVWVQIMEFKTGRAKENAYISKRTEKGMEVKKVAYSERNKKLDDDWSLIGIGCKGPEDEKAISLVNEDAINFILAKFKDGDSVFVKGDVSHSENKGNTYHNYEIKAIYSATSNVDFSAEDFDEISEFKQKFVFKDMADIDTQYLVSGYTFDYREESVDVAFTIGKDENGKSLAKAIEEHVESGDLLTVEGVIHNRATYRKADEEESTDVFAGKSSKTFSDNTSFIKEGERRELEIIGISEQPVKGAFASMDEEEDSAPEKMPWD